MIFLLLFMLCTASLKPEMAWAEDAAPTVMQKARQDAEKMTLPVNKHTETGQRAAKRSAEIFQSSEFQEKLQCQQQRLEQEVLNEHATHWRQKAAQEKPGDPATTNKIYLFLSSSVPEETVRTYIATIARAKGSSIVPVLRGLIKGRENIEASADYFSRILREDPDCEDKMESLCRRYQVPLRIDPTLFERYGITRVPAVVYAGEKDTFLIQGDVGLEYLLERINRDAKGITLANLINQLRGPIERTEHSQAE